MADSPASEARTAHFGREFDSLADVISFRARRPDGVSVVCRSSEGGVGGCVRLPALRRVRLARFNTAAAAGAEQQQEFTGFPIPAAAGADGIDNAFYALVVWGTRHQIGQLKWVLPPLMLGLSIMMFSQLSYPSVQGDHLAHHAFYLALLIIAVVLLFTVLNMNGCPCLFLIFHLLYGLVALGLKGLATRDRGRTWRKRIDGGNSDRRSATRDACATQKPLPLRPNPTCPPSFRSRTGRVEPGENFGIRAHLPVAGQLQQPEPLLAG